MSGQPAISDTAGERTPRPSASPVPGSGSRPSPRREALGLLLGAVAVLVLSFLLKPDPRGYGTHQQLLMPPCVFQLITRLPCPFCGMTTGFAHMARGDWQGAWQSNIMAPLGFGLAGLAVLAGLWGVITNRPCYPRLVYRAGPQKVFAVVIGLAWVVNLVMHLGRAP